MPHRRLCVSSTLTKIKQTDKRLKSPEGLSHCERCSGLSTFTMTGKLDEASLGVTVCKNNISCPPAPHTPSHCSSQRHNPWIGETGKICSYVLDACLGEVQSRDCQSCCCCNSVCRCAYHPPHQPSCNLTPSTSAVCPEMLLCSLIDILRF